MDNFSKRTLARLARKGITVMSTVLIPDMEHPMPWANAETAYSLNDNGTQKVRRFHEVLALAE